ncbi:MAG TPA: phospholipase [Solirubrobacteraceae bacterium]|nr:phospholipase [Solirubrobacteraceae bacterium]
MSAAAPGSGPPAGTGAAALPHRIRPAAGEPEGALVLMHGRGADEYDLVPLLDILDPRRRLLGITPGGPLHLPPGGRHWYAVPRVGYPDPATFAQGFGALTAFLDGLGLDWSRTILGGFSQGSVMSYAVGLGEGRPLPAGIVALSGFLPTVESWSLRDDIPQGFPVAIGHGTHDPIISVDFGRAARERLEAAGADVTWHESPIGHNIDPRFLGALPEWVDRVLP